MNIRRYREMDTASLRGRARAVVKWTWDRLGRRDGMGEMIDFGIWATLLGRTGLLVDDNTKDFHNVSLVQPILCRLSLSTAERGV